jgi:uroporphyrinogen decarboxylase
VFDFAIETPEDLKRLDFKPDVKEVLAYVYDGIFWTRQRVGNEVPVIGFSGAPWTLMGYMVEGGAVRSFDRAKKWLYLYPEDSRRLLSALRDLVVEYLVCQYDAGAPLLQVFDTNTGELPPSVYDEFCVPDLKYIATEVKRQRPKAIMSVFPKDGEIATFDDSDYDVVGVSWRASPAEARRSCPSKTLQGNLDPHLLYAEPDRIAARARKMVTEFGVQKYICNLGHGMLPTHPTEGPKAFLESVDTCTQDSIAASGPLGQHRLKTALNRFTSMFKEKMAE